MSVIVIFVYISMIYFNCIETFFPSFVWNGFLMIISCYSKQQFWTEIIDLLKRWKVPESEKCVDERIAISVRFVLVLPVDSDHWK